MNIGKRTVYIFLTFSVTSLLNLISLRLYTNVLSPKLFGQFVYIQGFYMMAVMIVSSGLKELTYKYYHSHATKILYIQTCLFIFFAAICSLTYIAYTALSNDSILDDNLSLLIGIYFTLVLIDVFNSFLQVENLLKNYTIGEILRSVLKLFLPGFFFTLLGGKSINYFLLGFIIAHWIVLIFQLPVIYKIFKKDTVKENNVSEYFNYKQILQYFLPILGWASCIQFINYSDRIFLKSILSDEQLGVYVANFTIFNFASQIVAYPLITSSHPVLLKINYNDIEQRAELQSLLKKLSILFLNFSVFCGSVSLLFYQEVVTFLLGEVYVIDIFTIFLIVISNIVWNLGSYFNKPFESSNKTFLMFIILICSFLLYLILNIYFLKYLGLIYAPIMKLISFSFYTFCLLFLTNKFNIIKLKFSFLEVVQFFSFFIVALFCQELLKMVSFNEPFNFIVKAFFSVGLVYMLLKFSGSEIINFKNNLLNRKYI